MHDDPFKAMQAAVDIVASSSHGTNKVAATVFNVDFHMSRTNYWPPAILMAYGPETEIGNSSGTVHAETSCIIDAGIGRQLALDGASLCVTDPFCPNCAKNIAEAGITTIYIDHKGFDKDFFQRRSDHFETMSMRVCEKAGISVYQIWRRDRRIVPIFTPPEGYVAPDDSPVLVEPVADATEALFADIIAQNFKLHGERKFATCLAEGPLGGIVAVTARGHAVRGFTTANAEDLAVIEQGEGKYSFFQEPSNRLLMHMARHGLRPVAGYFFSALVPTSREQVNLVGAGIRRVTAGDIRRGRDADALVAMRQLSDAGIIDFT